MWIERLPGTFDCLSKEIVQRMQDIAGGRVMAFRELLGLFRMTLATISGCNNGGDDCSVMVKRIGVLFIGLVAFDTSDIAGGSVSSYFAGSRVA